MEDRVFAHGATIGILGGGQLGQMTAMAAATLGYKTVVWWHEEDAPAMQVVTHKVIAPFEDLEAFEDFIKLADLATLEFENVDAKLAEKIGQRIPMRPGANVLRIAQDRWEEKKLFDQLGIPTPRTHHLVKGSGKRLPLDFPYPAILKTCRNGYDGKGQTSIATQGDIARAWENYGYVPCVLQERLDFLCEASVIIARSSLDEIKLFPAVENEHRNSMLAKTYSPGSHLTDPAAFLARGYAMDIALKLQLVGLVALECFVMKDGRVLANEIAPRPHNSGHGTIEGNQTSQFEQQVRAICGLPLGKTDLLFPSWTMENLIGDDILKVPYLLRNPDAHLHLYGKGQVRPDRKMGHVTYLHSPQS